MTLLGPDLSNYQKTVNLPASGAQLVIAKVSEGSGFIDTYFAGTMRQAAAMGIPHGGYHFLRPGNGAAQCDFYLRLLGDPAGKLCALDVEVAGAGAAVPAFLDEFAARAPGHPLLVYSNHGLWSASGGPDLSRWSSFLVGWHAGYQDGLYSPASGSLGAIWATTAGRVRLSSFGGLTTSPLIQYTDRAQVPGIGSGVDGNAWTGTLDQLVALTRATSPAPAPRHHGGDMDLYQTPDGTIWDIGGGRKLALGSMDVVHAYTGKGGVVQPLTQLGADSIPTITAPLTPAQVTAAAETAIRGVLESLPAVPATVDTAALAAAVVAALPAAPAGTLTAADVETAAETAIRAVLHNA